MLRAGWLAAASYRINMLVSIAALAGTLVPLYFVGNALQPFMAQRISTEGSQYFAFLIVGMATYFFIATCASAPATTLSGAIATGTWEALLATPTRLPTLLAGLTSYNFIWTAIRATLLLLAGWVLGAHIAWDRALASVGILVLIMLAYLPFGLVAGALTLAFRTTASIPEAIMLASSFLGGVFYPTHVIPSWIRHVSAILPLTYGLRALRRVLLEDVPLRAVASDVAVLTAFAVVLMVAGTFAFAAALRYARRSGTLAQY
jgi:ABC-2 type transport system permease protein